MIGKLLNMLGLGSKGPATAIDPVCKMVVELDNPNGGSAEYQETKYYFCAPGCRVAFVSDPERHLD